MARKSRRLRARRQATQRGQLPTVRHKRTRPKSPSTSLSRLARLTVHAAARTFQKPRVQFKTTPVRTKSAPSTLTLRDRPITRTGSLHAPVVTERTVKTAMNLCEQKARRRAVLLAKSGGRGIKAPGPYKRHTEPCK